MIVLDASVVVELLIHGPLADSRSLAAAQRIDAHRSERLLADLAMIPAQRCPHTPLLSRMWELRHNFTAYDAAYIALAEATNSILYTVDQKLSNGHRARVAVFRY